MSTGWSLNQTIFLTVDLIVRGGAIEWSPVPTTLCFSNGKYQRKVFTWVVRLLLKSRSIQRLIPNFYQKIDSDYSVSEKALGFSHNLA